MGLFTLSILGSLSDFILCFVGAFLGEMESSISGEEPRAEKQTSHQVCTSTAQHPSGVGTSVVGAVLLRAVERAADKNWLKSLDDDDAAVMTFFRPSVD